MAQIFRSKQDSYEVERPYAEGGMGKAFLVKSQKSGERFFLKQLKLEKAGDWKAIQLFEREAKVLSQLNHPGIPKYIDSFYSEEDGGFVLVQSFVEGKPLQQLIEENAPLPLERFASYLKQALEVLAYLHALVPPVIHRDVTPRNIIVNGDTLYLVDFGSVKSALTQSTTMTTVGTFGYMSPEQVLGHAEAASDLYSLGMTFIALATHSDPSKLPLNKKTGRIDVEGVLTLPEHLNQILKEMILPGLEERLGDAKQALSRLAQKPEAQPALPKPLPASATARKAASPPPKKKHRFLKGFGAFVLLVLVVAWVSTLFKEEGEVGRFGGWFTGHAGTISAITGTLWGDYSAITSPNDILALAFSPDGTLLASVDDRPELIIWDADTGEIVHRFEKSDLGLSWPRWVSFTNDGKGLAFASSEEFLLFRCEDWTLLRSVSLKQLQYEYFHGQEYSYFEAFAVPSTEQILAVFVGKTETALFDLREEKILKRWSHFGEEDSIAVNVSHVAFSPEGDVLALGESGRVHLWDVQEGKKLREQEIEISGNSKGLVLSTGSRLLATFDYKGFMVWDTQTGARKAAIPYSAWSSYEQELVFSPDGALVAVTSNSAVRVFSLAQKKELAVFGPGESFYFSRSVQALAFSPDGTRLASGGRDQLVHLWAVPEDTAK